MLEDIERGAGDLAVTQRVSKGRFVDDPAAGHIDQPEPLLRPGQDARVDQVMRFAGQRHVKRYEVRFGHQFLERHQLDVELGGPLLRKHRVAGDHPHPKRLCSDRAKQVALVAALRPRHDLGPERDRGRKQWRERPHMREARRQRTMHLRKIDHRLKRFRNVPRKREHHRHRVLRRRDRISRRRIDHQHAGPGRGIDIDVVDASASATDDFEAAAGVDDPRIDSGFAANDQGVIVRDPADQRRRALLQLHVDLSVLAQPVDPRFGDRVGNENARHVVQATRLGSDDSSARRAAARAAPRLTGWPLASSPRSSACTVATTSSS